TSALTAIALAVLVLLALLGLALVVWGPAGLRRAWRALQEPAASPVAAARPAPAPARAPAAERSEALGLLAVLQEEARLVDFLKEPLEAYSDAQIGAAVRDVHRDAAAVIERLFAIRPLRKEAEGAPVELAPGFDAATVRLTGNVTGEAPRCEVPKWTGGAAGARVIAPAEVELR